ncbi:MAG: hypothetical protein LCH67_04685 [Bacteroidetes bacterium]|nr:hypothetical protein [Bacteroidota bacterium]
MKSLNTLMGKMAAVALFSLPMVTFAQQPTINNLRAYDKSGINQFETKKDADTKFDGLKVRIGAGFTQQFQSLSHENAGQPAAGAVKLYPRLAPGFNVAQANLYTDVQLADGIALNLTTYLSAKHHNESWVKGGYLQMDKIPFKGAIWDKLSSVMTIKAGHMEINYGDQHFRRTDGGHALYNPFIENYIMDAFATEIGAEAYVKKNDVVAMIALSNGLINGGVQKPLMPGSTTETAKRAPSVYGKLAYDKTLAEKTRVRVAGSFYANQNSGRSTLYGGDRTGSNYWFVLEPETATATANAFSGRVNPGFTNQITALQFNLFAKVQGLEFFGTFENAKGGTNAEKVAKLDKRSANQIATDLIYRIGQKENVFLGLRYNVVNGQMIATKADKQKIDRVAFAGGWFITDNVLLKGEYVKQKYTDYPTGNILNGGKFDGIVIEAIVGF